MKSSSKFSSWLLQRSKHRKCFHIWTVFWIVAIRWKTPTNLWAEHSHTTAGMVWNDWFRPGIATRWWYEQPSFLPDMLGAPPLTTAHPGHSSPKPFVKCSTPTQNMMWHVLRCNQWEINQWVNAGCVWVCDQFSLLHLVLFFSRLHVYVEMKTGSQSHFNAMEAYFS